MFKIYSSLTQLRLRNHNHNNTYRTTQHIINTDITRLCDRRPHVSDKPATPRICIATQRDHLAATA